MDNTEYTLENYKSERKGTIVISQSQNGDIVDCIRFFEVWEDAEECFIQEVIKIDDSISETEAYQISMQEQEYSDSGKKVIMAHTYCF